MNNEKVLIGLSGGINSMAVLCWLIEQKVQPSELHIFYAHFREHSPDTFRFVMDGIELAESHFNTVKWKITFNSVLDFFEKEKLIPHPTVSPCSRKLKIEPIDKYAFENGIRIDLVGYVKHEIKRRSGGQFEPQLTLFDLEKSYPIGDFTDDWCFEIVKKHLGWYPAIYDIVEKGKRVFLHNNCLPCKNMYPHQMEAVKTHFPKLHYEAMRLSALLSSYWGRDKDEFYQKFGRELGQEVTCENCKW